MNLLRNFILVLCLQWVPAAGLVARANAPQPPSWNLPARIQTTGEGVFLRDLVPQVTAAEFPHVRLFAAPQFGKALTLTRTQIAQAIQQQVPDLTVTNWTGAERVLVTRRTRTLNESEVLEWLTTTLQKEHVKDRGQLELRFSRPWVDAAIPDETLTLRVVDLPTAGLSASCIVRFELRTETETVGTWQTAVQTRIWRDVLVARSPLSRGMLASHADIGTERRDVLTNRDALVALPGAAETLEVTGNVSAGSTLTARSLRFRPVVNRGKVVDAIVQNGSLQISMRVEVLEDGLPGQTIRVRNPKTKREFRGTVQNEQTIYVSL